MILVAREVSSGEETGVQSIVAWTPSFKDVVYRRLFRLHGVARANTQKIGQGTPSAVNITIPFLGGKKKNSARALHIVVNMKKVGLLLILISIFSVVSQVLFLSVCSLDNDAAFFENPVKTSLTNPSSGAGFFQNITFHYNPVSIAKIESVSLLIDGVENQTFGHLSQYLNDSTKEFGEKLKQRVSSAVPLVINYDESRARNETVASPQLLSAVLLYKVTGNKTYLGYAIETALWLNSTRNRQFLLFWYNTTSKQRAHVSTNGFDINALIALTEQDGRFLQLTNWALNEFHRIFVPKTNLGYVSVHFDETPDIGYADLGNQAQRIALFSYAYSITKNTTYGQWAKDLTSAFWDRRSAINMTPAYLDQDGSAKYNYIKEDQHAGNFLLALESAYYYTKDDYYKEIIKTYANAASTYFWDASVRRFLYRIDWETGAVLWRASVHGFSMLDMGLVNAYILMGNQTFLERARSDYNELVVKGCLLRNGLIVHGIDNNNKIINPQSNWAWNKFAFPAGYVFYVLTKNQTYLNALNLLYRSLQYHWKTHGYVGNIDSYSLSPIGSSIFLAEYVYVLNAMLHLYRELHGDAGTSNTSSDSPFLELGDIQYTNPFERFGTGNFEIKNFRVDNHVGNLRIKYE